MASKPPAMVTIKHVARRAGVSVATVSRVLNQSAVVSPETEERVREVVAQLGYTPHGAARSLITNRTMTVGVLLPDLYGEFFSEVIRGIDQVARQQGYHLLVANAGGGKSALEAGLDSMWGRVDGLIVMSPEMSQRASHQSLPEGFPMVLVNCPPSDLHCASLAMANYEGAAAMTRHLLGLGHRRIAVIRGPDANFDARERLRGYRDALKKAGLGPDPSLEFAGDFREASGYQAATQILALPARPTAVFATNDGMALGALFAFREAGLRLPEDLALGGFDDIPMARYMEPALTSVHVDISALGQRAALKLFLALQQPPAEREANRETLATTLVVRKSCGSQMGTVA